MRADCAGAARSGHGTRQTRADAKDDRDRCEQRLPRAAASRAMAVRGYGSLTA